MTKKKIIRSLLIIALVLVVIKLFVVLKENIHTVIPNQVYRSAQLNPTQLAKIVKKDHIKSVINLRGDFPQASWYQDEIIASYNLNLLHYDLSLDTKNASREQDLAALSHLLLTAPRPLLIHCKRGADRTGLAAAISLILAEHPYHMANEQVFWLYGAVSAKSTGRVTLPLYKKWLAREHLVSGRASFLSWVNQLTAYKNYPMKNTKNYLLNAQYMPQIQQCKMDFNLHATQ